MSNGFSVRPAVDDDCEFCYLLSMDPSVREMSVRSDEFSYDEHLVWWQRRMSDPNTKMYIAEVGGRPVGQVRYGLSGNAGEAEIAIAVLPGERGRGYASRLLGETERLAASALAITTLTALVIPRNTVSILLFESAGYRYVREEMRLGKQVRRYEKEVTSFVSTTEMWGPVSQSS